MLYPNHIFPFCPPLFSYFFAKFYFLFILYKIGFYFLLYNPVPTRLFPQSLMQVSFFLLKNTVSNATIFLDGTLCLI